MIGVTRMVTQLPHFPIGHSLDSPGDMVPDEANLGYLSSLNVRSRGVIDIDQDANAFPIAVLTLGSNFKRMILLL